MIELIDDDRFYDFTEERNLELLNDKGKKYVKGDKEVTVCLSIPGENIYEIHPVLVDVLDLFASQGMEDVYNEIISRIKNGELEATNVEDIIKEIPFNELEKKFVESYYRERLNIDDASNNTFGFEEGKDKRFYGQCLRTEIAKKCAYYFMIAINKYNPKNTRRIASAEGRLECYEENARMYPSSDEDKKNGFNFGGLRVGVKKGCSVKIPFGMKYYYEDGELTGYGCSYIKLTKGERGEDVVLSSKEEWDIIKKPKINDLNHPATRREVEEYIIKNRTINRYGNEIYGFDDSNHCIQLYEEIDPYSEKIRYRVRDYVKNENDKIIMGYDPRGYDRNHLDFAGTNKYGIPASINFNYEDNRDFEKKAKDIIKATMEMWNKKPLDEFKIPEDSPLERSIKFYIDIFIKGINTYENEEKKELYYKRIATEMGIDEKLVNENMIKNIKTYMEIVFNLAKKFDIDDKKIAREIGEKHIKILLLKKEDLEKRLKQNMIKKQDKKKEEKRIDDTISKIEKFIGDDDGR